MENNLPTCLNEIKTYDADPSSQEPNMDSIYISKKNVQELVMRRINILEELSKSQEFDDEESYVDEILEYIELFNITDKMLECQKAKLSEQPENPRFSCEYKEKLK